MSTVDKLLAQSPPSLTDSCLASVGNANPLRTSLREQECGWGVAPLAPCCCAGLLITKQEKTQVSGCRQPCVTRSLLEVTSDSCPRATRKRGELGDTVKLPRSMERCTRVNHCPPLGSPPRPPVPEHCHPTGHRSYLMGRCLQVYCSVSTPEPSTMGLEPWRSGGDCACL